MNVQLFTHSNLDGCYLNIILKALYPKNKVQIQLANYQSIDRSLNQFLNTSAYQKTDILLIGDLKITDSNLYTKLDVLKESHRKVLLINDRNLDQTPEHSWIRYADKKNFPSCSSFKLLEMITKYPKAFGEITDNQAILKNLKTAVELVRKHDTWLWQNHPDEDFDMIFYLNRLFRLLGFDGFSQWTIAHDCQLNFEEFSQLLKVDQQQFDFYISDHLKHAKLRSPFTVCGQSYRPVVCYAENYVSELASELLRKFLDANVAIIINANRQTVSYRSVDNVNVNDLASQFNGGGLPNAAGGPLDYKLKALIL